MRCAYQCHEIGGPWIAENPECPVHSREAVAEREDAEAADRAVRLRLEVLERRFNTLNSEVVELRGMVKYALHGKR